MLKMTRPVGKMSSNKIEDVTLVQAALKQVKGRNGRPLWPGPIDGNAPAGCMVLAHDPRRDQLASGKIG